MFMVGLDSGLCDKKSASKHVINAFSHDIMPSCAFGSTLAVPFSRVSSPLFQCQDAVPGWMELELGMNISAYPECSPVPAKHLLPAVLHSHLELEEGAPNAASVTGVKIEPC